jgi:CRP-like cAMP-binding protein
MNVEERTLVQNRFLGALSADLRATIGRYLEPVSYPFRHRLYGPGDRPRAAYFPVTGVISVVVTMADGKAIEAITLGHQSVAASECRFPNPSTGMRTAFAQVVGNGWKCEAADMRVLAERNPEFRMLLDRHATTTINVLAQTAACNRLHPVEERCARWLLLTAESAQMDEFDLIHEFLAEMLGIKRSSVSPAAAGLQERGLIEYTRGRMRILNRDGLRDASCECYGAITREYDALYERSNKR